MKFQSSFHFSFSVVPKNCLFGCTCYYSLVDKANIFNCSNANLTHLPERASDHTNWLIASRNNLKKVFEVKQYMKEIIHLDLRDSKVTEISNDVVDIVLQNVKYLNVANNSLRQLPRAVTKARNETYLRISNNPYECNCDMMWTRDWLLKAPNVMDKENAKCATGKMKGRSLSSPCV